MENSDGKLNQEDYPELGGSYLNSNDMLFVLELHIYKPVIQLVIGGAVLTSGRMRLVMPSPHCIRPVLSVSFKVKVVFPANP